MWSLKSVLYNNLSSFSVFVFRIYLFLYLFWEAFFYWRGTCHPAYTSCQHTLLLTDASNSTTNHVIKLRSSKTVFFLCLFVLHDSGFTLLKWALQPSDPWNPVNHPWDNGRFASWVYSWQICSKLHDHEFHQYEPKSLRNVSSTC